MTNNTTTQLRAGVCTHGQRDWIDILDCFESVHIEFITCQHHLKSVYQSSLPQSTVISIAECNRGLVPESGLDSLTREELNELGKHWKNLTYMIDRVEVDPNRPRISNHQRSHLINKVSVYYLELIRECDFIFFADVPHNFYDYLLYVICKIRNKRTFILKKSLPLPRYFTLSETIGWEMDSNINASAKPSEDFRENIQELISSKTRSYKDCEPYYMLSQKKLKNYGSLWNYLKKPSSLLTAFAPKSKVSVESVLTLSYSTLPSVNQIFYLSYLPRKIANYYYKKTLRQRYKQHSHAFEINELQACQYIFLGLHFQPEMTSLPLGGVFFDQELLVRTLHSSLPEGWKLLVKEHPSQLEGPQNSISGRWSQLYEALDSLENVYLCDYKTDTFQLIDYAQFVASISGTIMLEALARKKQVLLFGDIWMKCLKAVHPINSKQDIVDALKSSYPYQSDQELVDDMVSYMHDFFYSATGNSRKESQDVMARALKFLERDLRAR